MQKLPLLQEWRKCPKSGETVMLYQHSKVRGDRSAFSKAEGGAVILRNIKFYSVKTEFDAENFIIETG
jgi:hypothetical protein